MEKLANKVENYRQIKVKYISPTNSKASRVKIYEPKRHNYDKTESKTFSFCYQTGCIMEQAYKILIDNGFKIIARASENENYIFLCDNWGEDFKKVSELKD